MKLLSAKEDTAAEEIRQGSFVVNLANYQIRVTDKARDLVQRSHLVAALNSPGRYGLFMRCFCDARWHKVLLKNLGDGDLQAALGSLGQNPTELTHSLLSVLGNDIFNLRAKSRRQLRFAQFLEAAQSQGCLRAILSGPGAAPAWAGFYGRPVSAKVIDYLARLGAKETLATLLRAGLRMQNESEAGEIHDLWQAARPITTQQFRSDPTAAEIRSSLGAIDGAIRRRVLGELLSSRDKLKALVEFIKGSGGAYLVVDALSRDPLDAQKVLFAVLKTEGGSDRLADFIGGCLDVALALAANPKLQAPFAKVLPAPLPAEIETGGSVLEILYDRFGPEPLARILVAASRSR